MNDLSKMLRNIDGTTSAIEAFEVTKEQPVNTEVLSSIPLRRERREIVVVTPEKTFILGAGHAPNELHDLLYSLKLKLITGDELIEFSKMCWLMDHGYDLNTYSGKQELRDLLKKQFRFKGMAERQSVRLAERWADQAEELGFSRPHIDRKGPDAKVSLFEVAGTLTADNYDGPYLYRVDVRIQPSGICQTGKAVQVYPM
jgi:hypothetical protein